MDCFGGLGLLDLEYVSDGFQDGRECVDSQLVGWRIPVASMWQLNPRHKKQGIRQHSSKVLLFDDFSTAGRKYIDEMPEHQTVLKVDQQHLPL